jgi:hypothetical protein
LHVFFALFCTRCSCLLFSQTLIYFQSFIIKYFLCSNSKLRYKSNGRELRPHKESLFENVFPDVDDFSEELHRQSHRQSSISIVELHELQQQNRMKKDTADMNNLYESSESNDETTQRQLRNQTKINSLALSLSRLQHESMTKKKKKSGHDANEDSYEEYGDSSDDEDGSSDDSDEPKRILVKIKPIEEVDRANAATPDILNQISKGLKLKFENSEKVHKIKRKTYIRKIRSSFRDQNNNSLNNDETETAESFQQQPNLTNQQLSDKVSDYFKSDVAKESALQQPISLFDFNFDSYDSKKDSDLKRDSSSEQSVAPPLPPLPADLKIYEKLSALKNLNGGSLSLRSTFERSSFMSTPPPNENSFSFANNYESNGNNLGLSMNGDLETSIAKSLYDTANSNDEMTF